jgi:hypothetical protein
MVLDSSKTLTSIENSIDSGKDYLCAGRQFWLVWIKLFPPFFPFAVCVGSFNANLAIPSATPSLFSARVAKKGLSLDWFSARG